MNTEPVAPPQAPAPVQHITYAAPDQPPSDSGTHHLLMMSSDEVNLQTRRNQYGSTPEAQPAHTPTNTHPTDQSLRIPPPPLDGAPKAPRFPLRRINNNPNARAASNYNIVDDLAQSPAAMSALEVLKNCPSQRKTLLSAIGAIDPHDSQLMAYDLDHSEPRLPSNLSFQVTVSIRNFVVHRCIIDEGASTCVMPTSIWQKMGSPPLQPSSTALRAYDGRSAQP